MRLSASVIADVSEFGGIADGDGVRLSATRPVMASKKQVQATGQHVMVSVRSGSYGILENGDGQKRHTHPSTRVNR